MKAFYTLAILFIAAKCFCQPYHCINRGYISYFINDNNYLRAMRIDSVKTIGTDTILYPFKTFRGDFENTHNVLLTAKGSWLGEKVTIRPDGVTYFDNYWGDTLFIKTNAQTGDSWVLYDDTTSMYFTATVTKIDTMSVLGIIDSVKYIRINTYNYSGNFGSSQYNNEYIILSKQNGLVRTFDLYMFPMREPVTKIDFDLDYYHYLAKSPFFKIVKFNNASSAEIYNFALEDLFEYDVYDFSPMGPPSYIKSLFTVKSKTSGGLNTISYSYDIAQKTYIPMPVNSTSTKKYTDIGQYAFDILIDTTILPEEIKQTRIFYYFPNDTSFCTINDKYFFNSGALSGDGRVNRIAPCGRGETYKKGLGRIAYWLCREYRFSGIDEKLIYVNKNGNSCGTFVPVFPAQLLGINEENIKAYPNPANDILNITLPTDYATATITLSSLDGKPIKSIITPTSEKMSVEELPSGIYILTIADKETGNKLISRICVSH